MTKHQRTAEQKKTIFAAKVIGAILLAIVLVPLPIVMTLRHCNLFPDSWPCAGEDILLSPVAIAFAICAVAICVFGVYHIFKGQPK